MIREGEFLKLRKKSPSDATVIIRADADAAIGAVQEVIQICQDAKFETFALRAEEKSNDRQGAWTSRSYEVAACDVGPR